MDQQGRHLSIRMQGQDVAPLHNELLDLGLTIPDDEVRRQLFGEATLHAVREFQRRHGLEPTGVVDEGTGAQINAAFRQLPRIVRGQIREADGSLFGGAIVRAFDKDMRSEESLGEATTDPKGRYQIRYTAEQFRRAEKGSADLRVSVCNEAGRELASSQILFNAPLNATVDLVIGGSPYRGPSEYERYLEELTPVMQGVQPADLREDQQIQDISFLSSRPGSTRNTSTF